MSQILERLSGAIGQTRRSDWLLIDQVMIDRFADVTRDHQYIHVDPARAAASPFGGTIAHGFLTLSLLSHFAETLAANGDGRRDSGASESARMSVNYGFDRVRFTQPVRAGQRVRLALTLTAVDEKRPNQFQLSHEAIVEIENEVRPALVALWLSQVFY